MGQAESSDHCKTLGGRLALVTSADEMKAIWSYMRVFGSSYRVWVDGTDAATEGVWVTEAGEPMSYLGFTGVQPNGGTKENCIGVAPYHVFDITCTSNTLVFNALCEYYRCGRGRMSFTMNVTTC